MGLNSRVIITAAINGRTQFSLLQLDLFCARCWMKMENQRVLILNTLLYIQLKGTYGWEVPSCTRRTKGQESQQWNAEHLDVCPCTLLGNMISDNRVKIAQEANDRSENQAQTSFSSLLYSNHLPSRGGGYTRC